jgi:hypothetical protein
VHTLRVRGFVARSGASLGQVSVVGSESRRQKKHTSISTLCGHRGLVESGHGAGDNVYGRRYMLSGNSAIVKSSKHNDKRELSQRPIRALTLTPCVCLQLKAAWSSSLWATVSTRNHMPSPFQRVKHFNIQGRQHSTIIAHAIHCFYQLQTSITSQSCIDQLAISPHICVSRLYPPQTRKHPPCSSASTRNVPSSRTSNNYVNSVPVLLVRWSSWKRNCLLSPTALKVRRLIVRTTTLVLTLAAIATVLSNWHTVLRAIHMASGMCCSRPLLCFALLT